MKITLHLQYCDIENLGLGLAQAYGLFAGMSQAHPLFQFIVSGHVHDIKTAMYPMFAQLTAQGIHPPNHPEAPAGDTPVQIELAHVSVHNLHVVLRTSLKIMKRLLAQLPEELPAHKEVQQRLDRVTTYISGFQEARLAALAKSGFPAE